MTLKPFFGKKKKREMSLDDETNDRRENIFDVIIIFSYLKKEI